MRLKIEWSTDHKKITITDLMASGNIVPVLDASGNKLSLPAVMKKNSKLRIPKASVAYGGKQKWQVLVLVDEPSANDLDKLTGLTITAVYDDTVDPGKKEPLCTDKAISPNTLVVIDATLTIPKERET